MRDNETRRVYPLRELDDYEVADHDPDIRGWSVHSADGTEIGEVDELLVEPAAKKVRYLSLDLKGAESGGERRVLVPVGAAQLREDDRDVVLGSLNARDVQTLPDYRSESFDEAYETDLRTRFKAGHAPVGGNFYEHDIYDDRRLYGSGRTGR